MKTGKMEEMSNAERGMDEMEFPAPILSQPLRHSQTRETSLLYIHMYICVCVYLFDCSASYLLQQVGLNLGPLHWERGVLATGPPGKTQGGISQKSFPLPSVSQYPGGTEEGHAAQGRARAGFRAKRGVRGQGLQESLAEGMAWAKPTRREDLQQCVLLWSRNSCWSRALRRPSWTEANVWQPALLPLS